MENQENIEKFMVGPTRLNPGPMFPRQEAAAETFVIRSNPFSESSTVPAKNTNRYVKIKFDILIAVPLLSSLSLRVIGVILLG